MLFSRIFTVVALTLFVIGICDGQVDRPRRALMHARGRRLSEVVMDKQDNEMNSFWKRVLQTPSFDGMSMPDLEGVMASKSKSSGKAGKGGSKSKSSGKAGKGSSKSSGKAGSKSKSVRKISKSPGSKSVMSKSTLAPTAAPTAEPTAAPTKSSKSKGKGGMM